MVLPIELGLRARVECLDGLLIKPLLEESSLVILYGESQALVGLQT